MSWLVVRNLVRWVVTDSSLSFSSGLNAAYSIRSFKCLMSVFGLRAWLTMRPASPIHRSSGSMIANSTGTRIVLRSFVWFFQTMSTQM